MRQIADHIVEGDSANHQIQIVVMDEPGAGGANHRYELRSIDWETNASSYAREGFDVAHVILFQNGPIKEWGVNGLTQEVLLAIIIDRLRSFQAGPFATTYNQSALESCENALNQLQHRTRERLKRGVEGTNKQ